MAGGISEHLGENDLWTEAKQVLSEHIPLALEVFGPDDLETLKMRWRYAIVLGHTENATHEDHIKAVATLEDVVRRCRRVLGLGTNNPMTANAERALAEARDLLSKS